MNKKILSISISMLFVFSSTETMGSGLNSTDYLKYGESMYDFVEPHTESFVRCKDMYGADDKTAFLTYFAYQDKTFDVVYCARAFLENEGDLEVGETVSFTDMREVGSRMKCPTGYAITGFGREGYHYTKDPDARVSYECTEIRHANGAPLELTDDELVATNRVSAEQYNDMPSCWDATSGTGCSAVTSQYRSGPINGMLVGRSVDEGSEGTYTETLIFKRVKGIRENTQLTVSNNLGSQVEFDASLKDKNGDTLNVKETVISSGEYVSPELISPLNGAYQYHYINQVKLVGSNTVIDGNCYIWVEKNEGKFSIDNDCNNLDTSIDSVTGSLSINVN
ncbi:hypothetical protein L1D31_22255 [Vibrio sp. Isolate23]|uniref:hypothetical protein n=1 Tax=Vibrio sp. Isolate23 TaxID=2908533 RepID=UPI001EFD186F|nr:hypothetical protein [Vibrio sp. Isolate23]MCG9685242.1 hypothetical protein [Vibrio sp. Isolate23]